MVFHFSNSLSSSIRKGINLLFFFLSPPLSLNVFTYLLYLGNIKINGLTTSPKYQIKYLELFFVLANFEMTVLQTLTFQIFIGFFCTIKFLFCYFCLTKSQPYFAMNKFCCKYILVNSKKHLCKNIL